MKKKILIVSLIAIVLIAVGVGGWFLWNSQQKETAEQENKTSKNETAENTSTDKNSDNTLNTTNNNNQDEDDKTNNNENSTALEKIKKSLKDENWVKNNVSLEYGNVYPENQPQKHTFIVVKNDPNAPVIIVKTQRQNDLGIMQAYIVTYKDNKVIANAIAKDLQLSKAEPGTDIKVDISKEIVNYYSDLNGGEENCIYSIKNGNPELIDIYGNIRGEGNEGYSYFKEHYYKGVSTISQSEYNTIKNKYKSTAYNRITRELTTKNIDTYIK